MATASPTPLDDVERLRPLELVSEPAPRVKDPSERRSAHARRRLVGVDVLALLVAWAAPAAVLGMPQGAAFASLLAVIAGGVSALRATGVYERETVLLNRSSLDEVPTVVPPLVGAVACSFLLSHLLETGWASTHAAAVAFAATITVPVTRALTRRFLRLRRGPQRCLIVGGGEVARSVARKIIDHPEYGVEACGHVDEPWDQHDSAGGVPWLGTVEDFAAICAAHDVDRIVVAFSALSHEHLLEVIREARRLDLPVSVVPRLFETIGTGVVVDEVEGLTLLGVRSSRRSQAALRSKRLLDICASALALIVLTPLLLAIALAIRVTSPGPVLFAQERIGRRGRPFRIFKFRTMVADAEARKAEVAHLNVIPGPMFKIPDDPRVTRAGGFLRRTSLDELPQLLNVLRGEMSLVGPRPLIPSEDNAILGRHRDRLSIKPGITGPWQALGRNDIPFEEMMRLDYLYAAEWSVWHDVRLIARTAMAVVRPTGL